MNVEDKGRSKGKKATTSRRPASKKAAPAKAIAAPKGVGPADPFHILAMDGGGIYGLVSAIWLRQLCEQIPTFLEGSSVDMFAGISAGAINVLLLCKYDNPREAVLKGELENFWLEDVGAFSNVNPMSAWLARMGLGGLVGEEDFLTQLEKYFGDMTLGDLRQSVLIPTFNWTGQRKDIDFGPRGARGHFALARGSRGEARPWWVSPKFAAGDAWRPKVFSNMPGDADCKYRVVDIAYGAATPAGIRAVRGGIGDAATYTGNPAMEAISGAVHLMRYHERSKKEPHETYKASIDPVRSQMEQRPVMVYDEGAGRYLDRVSMMSIGNGAVAPNYWLQNFDFSLALMSMLPTNPLTGFLAPPGLEAQFNGTAKAAHYFCTELLGRRYHRLCPQLMPTPVVAATLMCRYPALKDAMVRQIRGRTDSIDSRWAVQRAASFLKNGWRGWPFGNDAAPE